MSTLLKMCSEETKFSWHLLLYCSRPWVEYKGTIPQNEMLNKKKDLELEANRLISVGGKVSYSLHKLIFIYMYIYTRIYTYIASGSLIPHLGLLLRFLLIYYHMMKLLGFVVVSSLIMFPRSVHKSGSISKIISMLFFV